MEAENILGQEPRRTLLAMGKKCFANAGTV